MRVVSSFFIILLFSFSAAAIELIFPLDCDLGKDCWISNLPRHYLRDKQVDFRCGPNTYDGHKGTDFALKDYKQMEKVFHKCKQFVQLVSLSQLNYMYLCSSHLVTSSTWCAQALFLRMGASPCQMTRICWGQNFCPITRTAEYENCWITRICWEQKTIKFQQYFRFWIFAEMI